MSTDALFFISYVNFWRRWENQPGVTTRIALCFELINSPLYLLIAIIKFAKQANDRFFYWRFGEETCLGTEIPKRLNANFITLICSSSLDVENICRKNKVEPLKIVSPKHRQRSIVIF